MTKKMTVSPRGFPGSSFASRSIETGKKETLELILPSSFSNLKTRGIVYLNPTSSILSAIDRLIREPYGCFEQTSSVVYPMVMAVNLLRKSATPNNDVLEKAEKFLDDGYKKLAGYEVKGGGYEWFGQSPAHEALTAYGILEVKTSNLRIFIIYIRKISFWNCLKFIREWI